MQTTLATLVSIGAVLAVGALLRVVTRSRRYLGGPAEQATYQTLHTVSVAARSLRGGLDAQGAGRAARHLRALLGCAAVAVTDGQALLAWDGAGERHAPDAVRHARHPVGTGRSQVLHPDQVACDDPDCPLLHAVIAPLTAGDHIVGTLGAYHPAATAGLVRAVGETARWVSTQLELAELDRSRTRLAEMEVRALRAQISPHFIYNSLTTIAAFVRSQPDRARELLLEFAHFTRYSFRNHGEFTTLAEELRSIDRYLLLEHARFGDRLRVSLRIAPEVLPVAVPFLCVQPLVENAVRHGLELKTGVGHVTIVAEDAGQECLLSVEDDGVGMDPDLVRRALDGERPARDSVGLVNIDERLRQVYGTAFGLVIETGPGAGTKVSLRIPKYKAGVSVS
ncbi:sensor histidine kinase [Actinomadura rubrisoli]|uniref:Sensor histidine kinase n=1 Tax=Actinomadura rubrisoli TaxID=2530368 RepID=A0A4R5ANZ2_9ACTN|nr:histidine kinase [Actinomadura rubrisoli]TDD73346.1 sensor histidine kinase [Actinomadura rubrisoli]